MTTTMINTGHIPEMRPIDLKQPRLCDTCDRKPCIDGFSTLRTLGIGKCRDYRPKRQEGGEPQ